MCCSTMWMRHVVRARGMACALHWYVRSIAPAPQLPPPCSLQVKLLGAGVDGTSVRVRVKSTGTVADIITTAVHNLRASKEEA